MAKQFYKVHNTQSDATDLFRAMTFITGMQQAFQVTRSSLLQVYGHCNLQHRGLVTPNPAWNGAVMWALRVGLRGPAASLNALGSFASPPSWIAGAKTGANILSIADHYATGEFEAATLLNSNGYYRVELWGCSASSLAPNTDGLIEVVGSSSPTDPYNQMIVLVEDYP